MTTTLDAILKPRSIAVIGDTRMSDTIGHQIFANLLRYGFTGAVYPVNPNATSTRRGAARAADGIGRTGDDCRNQSRSRLRGNADVRDVLLRISQLAMDHPEITELDVNPLLAFPGEVIAVDARVLVAATD